MHNIPEDVLAYGEKQGLEPIATGGGVDYMHMALPEAGSMILSAAEDCGSPESLKASAQVVILVDRDWHYAVYMPPQPAKAAIKWMAKKARKGLRTFAAG